MPIRPEDDPLRLHRFPAGEPWLRTEETDVGHRVVVVEALLPTPQDVDGDYFRARSPKTPPARNVVSAFVDPEAAVYEYQEVFRDPASPLAAARALSRAAVKQEEAFAQRFKAEMGTLGPRDADVRRAYRELLAEPFAREVAALAERPLFGPRERRELDLKLRFRAALVMPFPIVSANACVSGATAVWEFDQDDLYGRGFEMKASAIAR